MKGSIPARSSTCSAGHPIEVRWENQLPSAAYLQNRPPYPWRHASGACSQDRTPSSRFAERFRERRTTGEDGLRPGHSALYQYPNSQQAATLWYHDHALGITRLNVYAGLSGFFFLRDDQERSLNLPSGDYEIPLILQDRTLDDQGQLVYAPYAGRRRSASSRRLGADVLWRASGGEWRHLSVSQRRAASLSRAPAERIELTLSEPLFQSGEAGHRYPVAGGGSPDRLGWRISAGTRQASEISAGAGGARGPDRRFLRARRQDRHAVQ